MERPLICVDCRYLGPKPSGIGETVQALVDHLPSAAPDLRFLFLRNSQRTERLSNAANVTERAVGFPVNGPQTMWALPHLVDLNGVSLFHSPSNILPAGLAMPSVTTIHDIMWLTNPAWCNAGPWGRIEALFYANGIKRALRRSARIVTVSTASRDEMIAYRPDAADRISVTLSGVADDFRKLSEAESLAAMPPSLLPIAHKKLVLVVGQASPYKNHDGALAAFQHAFADRPDVDLVFVQRRGKMAEQLLESARAGGLHGRVHICRDLSRTELIALYNRAAVLLHPSLCEGFGNPLAEAMACGCPVVTSNRSAMPEVTGGAALLADPTDAIALAAALYSVIDDPVIASRMQRDGLVRAAQLSWRSFAEKNLAVYREVLAT